MRVLLAGRSGAGKTTLAEAMSESFGIPYVAMDPVILGDNLTRRKGWRGEIERIAAENRWVTELHFNETVEFLVPRAQLLIWLDPMLPNSYIRLVVRTVRRAASSEEVWPGFKEPPLRSVIWRRDHILRWALRAEGLPATLVVKARTVNPSLEIVRARRKSEALSVLQRLQQSLYIEEGLNGCRGFSDLGGGAAPRNSPGSGHFA
jgi:adenylate kinase family enzyme